MLNKLEAEYSIGQLVGENIRDILPPQGGIHSFVMNNLASDRPTEPQNKFIA